MRTVKLFSVLVCAAALCLAGAAFAQTDPGVQTASRGTGQVLSAASSANDPNLNSFFTDGQNRFQDVESVSGSPTGNNGLGPRFNFNSCVGCHSQPAIGGSGPSTNPQFKVVGNCANGVAQTPADQGVKAVACSTTNTTPAFITANGPTREARFPFFFNANGTVNTANPNGGVETLFTVSGRTDGATNCSLSQPSFAAAANANNLIFRIPTPVFGAGLIENLDDSTLLSNRLNNLNNNIGVSGTFNHNGNDGTITRFGWKAQNKSLHIFAGEAYNVEMGISNLLFQQDRPLPGEDGNGGTNSTGLPASCLNLTGGGYPEDSNNPGSTGAAVLDDVSAFANFMRLLAPPPTGGVILNGVAVSAASISNGRSLFSAVGCATCHNPTAGNTQPSNITASQFTGAGSLSNAPVNAFSDIEVHHMGTGLNDNVSQGGAGGDQFRTAPLWGLGQRIFFLHDGRCSDVICAVNAHGSNGSEANTALNNAAALSFSQQQDLVNFLRSL
jgi:CxxC motif-containing protein (DUF1111 family)